MNALEPNLVALAWFALFWSLCCVGFLVLSGSFPLAALRERGRWGSMPLALVNAVAMVALAGLTVAFGVVELKTTTLIIAMGLIFLFAPASFEIWPERWRDGRAVLTALLAVQVGALAGLWHVGAVAFPGLA